MREHSTTSKTHATHSISQDMPHPTILRQMPRLSSVHTGGEWLPHCVGLVIHFVITEFECSFRKPHQSLRCSRCNCFLTAVRNRTVIEIHHMDSQHKFELKAKEDWSHEQTMMECTSKKQSATFPAQAGPTYTSASCAVVIQGDTWLKRWIRK